MRMSILVEFIGSGFWQKDKTGNCHMPSEHRREVVGNIYEHPHLLANATS
jgi:hypothetical protein